VGRRVDKRQRAVDGERHVDSLAEAAGESEEGSDDQACQEEVLARLEEPHQVAVKRLPHLRWADLAVVCVCAYVCVRVRVCVCACVCACLCKSNVFGFIQINETQRVEVDGYIVGLAEMVPA